MRRRALGPVLFGAAACHANGGATRPPDTSPEPHSKPSPRASAAPPTATPSRSPGATARPASPACVRAGCSGELCVERGTGVMTACLYEKKFACYATARCERGRDGQCGWVETPELNRCLKSAP